MSALSNIYGNAVSGSGSERIGQSSIINKAPSNTNCTFNTSLLERAQNYVIKSQEDDESDDSDGWSDVSEHIQIIPIANNVEYFLSAAVANSHGNVDISTNEICEEISPLKPKIKDMAAMLTALLTNRKSMEDLSSSGLFRSSGNREESAYDERETDQYGRGNDDVCNDDHNNDEDYKNDNENDNDDDYDDYDRTFRYNNEAFSSNDDGNPDSSDELTIIETDRDGDGDDGHFEEADSCSSVGDSDVSTHIGYCTTRSNNNDRDDSRNRRNNMGVNNKNYNKYVHYVTSQEGIAENDDYDNNDTDDDNINDNESENENENENDESESQTVEEERGEIGESERTLKYSDNESYARRSDSPKPPPYSEYPISDFDRVIASSPISDYAPPPPPQTLLSLPPPPPSQPLPPPYTWSAGCNLHDRKAERKNKISSPKVTNEFISSPSISSSSSLLSSSFAYQNCSKNSNIRKKIKNRCENKNQGSSSSQSLSISSGPVKLLSSRPSYLPIDRAAAVYAPPSVTNSLSSTCSSSDVRAYTNSPSQQSHSPSYTSPRPSCGFSPSTFRKEKGLERAVGGSKGVFRRLDTTPTASSTQNGQHPRKVYQPYNSSVPYRDLDNGLSIYGYSKYNRDEENSLRQQLQKMEYDRNKTILFVIELIGEDELAEFFRCNKIENNSNLLEALVSTFSHRYSCSSGIDTL